MVVNHAAGHCDFIDLVLLRLSGEQLRTRDTTENTTKISRVNDT